jgi:pyruvate formate lyase activating enzyme
VIEATGWERAAGGVAACRLCPHRCDVAPGGAGACGFRRNVGGVLYAASYEEVTRLAKDPVEAVPLYHWRPGTEVLSVSSFGANLPEEATPFLAVPPAEGESRWFSAEEVVDMALGQGVGTIACTAPEPAMWLEYLVDIGRRARDEGLAVVAATNGYVLDRALADMTSLLSAVTLVFLGGDAVYQALGAAAGVGPVLAATDAFRAAGAHIEAHVLVVPGKNDDAGALAECGRLLAERVRPRAVHLGSSLVPGRAAPVGALRAAHERLRLAVAPLPVYLSNVFDPVANDTPCPRCGATLVSRHGARVKLVKLDPAGRCSACGARADTFAW